MMTTASPRIQSRNGNRFTDGYCGTQREKIDAEF